MDWLNNPEAFDRFHKDGVDDFPGAVAGAGINRRKNMFNSIVEEEDARFLCDIDIAILRERGLSQEELEVMVKLNRLTFEWQCRSQD
jgi:hypothetical protein